MKAQKNQRRGARYHCRVPVESKRGNAFFASQTIDVSRRGVGIISEKPVPINSRMAIEIILSPDSDESILAVGKVKWIHKIPNSKNYRVGMILEHSEESQQKKLEDCFQ